VPRDQHGNQTRLTVQPTKTKIIPNARHIVFPYTTGFRDRNIDLRKS
jgi:hypothetical protein